MKYHGQSKHEDRRFPCEYCDYVAAISCELTRHFRRKHKSEKFPCNLCDYEGKRPDHLRDHQRRIHHLFPETSPKKGTTKASSLKRGYPAKDKKESEEVFVTKQETPPAVPESKSVINHTGNLAAAAADTKPFGYSNYEQILNNPHFLLSHLPRTESVLKANPASATRPDPAGSRSSSYLPRGAAEHLPQRGLDPSHLPPRPNFNYHAMKTEADVNDDNSSGPYSSSRERPDVVVETPRPGPSSSAYRNEPLLQARFGGERDGAPRPVDPVNNMDPARAYPINYMI